MLALKKGRFCRRVLPLAIFCWTLRTAPFCMEKPKNTTEKPSLEGNTLLNMAAALNEIRIDFEFPDEHLEREDKIRVLKEIRDDLTEIFWNYDLVKRNKYDNGDQN